MASDDIDNVQAGVEGDQLQRTEIINAIQGHEDLHSLCRRGTKDDTASDDAFAMPTIRSNADSRLPSERTFSE